MKAYRNLRIGAKLSLVLSIVLIIGLGLLSFSSTTALSSSMRNTAEDCFMELADARATVVEQYMVGFRRFIKAFGTEDIIEMDLEDPTNEQLTQSAQACIEKYKDTNLRRYFPYSILGCIRAFWEMYLYTQFIYYVN